MRRVVQHFFRVPLHAQHERVGWVFQGFDQPVDAPGCGLQPMPKPAYGLMVERVRAHALGCNYLVQQRCWRNADFVADGVRLAGLPVGHPVRLLRGQVLPEGAAAGDVEHLMTAAYRQHRQASVQRAM